MNETSYSEIHSSVNSSLAESENIPSTIDNDTEVISRSVPRDDNSTAVENQADVIFGSQELFSENSMEVEEHTSNGEKPSPSTGSMNTTTHFNSLQLSGVESNGNADVSNEINHSKPQILSSPTSTEKLRDDILDRNAIQMSPEKPNETLDIPMWCKNLKYKEDSSSDKDNSGTSDVNLKSSGTKELIGNRNAINHGFQFRSNEREDSAGGVSENYNSNTFSLLSGADILKPSHSQVSKGNIGTQINESGESVCDIIPPMNFEFSQDFALSENNLESFTCLQCKVISPEEKGETGNSSCSKDTSHSSAIHKIDGIRSDEIEYSGSANDTNTLNSGSFVFGLWDKIYYPGIVKSVDKSAVVIHFHDNHVMAMPYKHVFRQQLFDYGQEVRVKSEDDYYHDALIMASFQHHSDVHHVVEVRNAFKVVNRNSICFTQSQSQKFRLNGCSNINHFQSADFQGIDINSHQNLSVANKRRRTEPLSGAKSLDFSSPSRKYVRYIPDKLFHGLRFLILADNLPNICKIYDNDNEKQVPIDIGELEKLIVENGGIIVSKLYGRDFQEASKVICISNDISASLQFIYCILVGIPILRADWIYKSVKTNILEPYDSFALPAGKDITGQSVEQNYSVREPYTPLYPLRIYVHIEGEIKNQNRLLDLILHKAGCERLFSSTYITEKTKKVPFKVDNIDFILSMVNHTPPALWEAAEQWNKKIVTSAWLLQCLINNQLLDVMDCPIFRFSKFVDLGGEKSDSHTSTNNTGDTNSDDAEKTYVFE